MTTNTNPWMETENAIVNSIMSGVNSCETLKKHVDTAEAGDPMPILDFLRGAVRSGNTPRFEEMAQMARDLRALSADVESKRFALEYIASNLGGNVQIADPAIVEAIRKALPGLKI